MSNLYLYHLYINIDINIAIDMAISLHGLLYLSGGSADQPLSCP